MTDKMCFFWMCVDLVLITAPLFVTAGVAVSAFDCKFNPKVCNPSSCKKTSPRGSMIYISIDCFLRHPLREIWVKAKILRKVNRNYETYIENPADNMCDLSSVGGNNYFLGRLITSALEKFPDLKCPLKGNVTLRKLPCMLFLTEGVFPNSEYKINYDVFNKEQSILNLNISFQITAKKLF